MKKTKDTIKCPQCGYEIEMTEVLSKSIEEKVRLEYSRKHKEEIEKEKTALQEQENKKFIALKNKLTKELEEKEKQLSEANSLTEELVKREKQLEEKEKNINLQIQKQLEEERKKITEREKEKNALEVKDLLNRLKEAQEKQKKSEEAELEFRRKNRELDEKQKALELEVERKLDEKLKLERKKYELETKNEIMKQLTKKEEEASLKLREKDEQMNRLKKQFDDFKRRAEQGSMELQGEAQELMLEELFRSRYPADSIEEVKKGARGADVIQKIFNKHGQYCGTIVWESKRTKDWQNTWLEKAKNDKTEKAGDLIVIVSQALPQEIKNFDRIDGVWVTSFTYAAELSHVLRESLINLYEYKMTQQNKGQKIELLYEFLTSTEFKNYIENIIDAFKELKSDLDTEKNSMNRIWKKREKHLDMVITNTTNMYGALDSFMGKALPQIEALELPPAEESEEKQLFEKN